MTPGEAQSVEEGAGIAAQVRRHARLALLSRISRSLEPVMMVLGIVFLLLMLAWYADLPVEIVREEYIDEAIQLIWVVFFGDFVLRYTIAPVKRDFLKRNWLIGLSLLLPILRPFQIFRVLQVFHGVTLVAFLGAADRSLRALRHITRGRVAIYLLVVTGGVVLAGAVGVHYFDRQHPDSPITGMPDALWWAATLVTTLTHELDVVSTEARLIAFGLRLYGLNVFCFFMASFASYLIGVDSSYSRLKDDAPVDPVHEEIRMLRAELGEMRALLGVQRADASPADGDAQPAPAVSSQGHVTNRTRLPLPPTPPRSSSRRRP